MSNIKDTIIDYAKQPSTYKGLAILAGVAGYSMSPELVEAITTSVVSVIGLIETIRNES